MSARLRIRPGHCLVKSRDDLSRAGRSTVLFSPGSPTKGIYFAEVLLCGEGVDEVKPGDVVVVQAMSSPPGWPDLKGDYFGDAVPAERSDRLSLVPLLKRTPRAQRREEEYALRYRRLEKARVQFPAPALRSEKLAQQMADDERELGVIRASRKGRARSRLINWTRETGVVAEGIIAVVEPD